MEEDCDEESEKQIDRSRGNVNIQVTKEERDNCVCVNGHPIAPFVTTVTEKTTTKIKQTNPIKVLCVTPPE